VTVHRGSTHAAGHASVDALLAEVLAASLPLPTTIWGFGVGDFLSGLVRAGAVLERLELVAEVRARVLPALARPPDPTDHLIPVEALCQLEKVDPSVDIRRLCRRWVGAVTSAMRPTAGQPPVHRPDLPRWRSTIWVDCMHTDGPGLALLGKTDEAVSILRESAAVLQRDDGLFQHGYDVLDQRGNGVAWGRGQAWALQGLVGTLGHPAVDRGSVVDLRVRLDRLVEALARHEDRGRWHTVVDDSGSPAEDSIGAYVAWLVPAAVRHRLVDPSFLSMTARARDATLANLQAGVLPTSEATPVGTADEYRARGVGAHPWGQAPVLHLLLDHREQASLATKGST